jgi:4-oxalocrotonate tautomerase
MPFVKIDLIAGRPPEKHRALIARVTDAVCEALEVQAETVRVVLNEVPPELWGKGGVSMAELRREQAGDGR